MFDDILNVNFDYAHFAIGVFVVSLLYYFATRSQRKAIKKVDKSLKLQKEANSLLRDILRQLTNLNKNQNRLDGVYHQSEEIYDDENDYKNSENKVYVGNVDYSVTEEELKEYFKKFGQIEMVNIPINKYTGKARGFGFVTFAENSSASSAVTLDGSEFKGRQIQVNYAKERDLS